jgi:Fe-S cluster biogenesis protein NfuA|tara:strand:- start:13067 stop:13321 length:255 start_codon:yes stop_codon:yes gene_type:complete
MDKKEVLEQVDLGLEKVRPFLQSDGGDIKIVGLSDDGVLTLEFLGNCSSCNMSNMTFKAAIEENVLNNSPEITAVEVTNLAHPK